MASPLENLQSKFKTQQGQLGTASTEETQALNAKAGQITSPQDPASVAAIGGTPQQAAMAGTTAALRSQIRQSMDLGAQKRQGAGVPQDQAAADAAKQKAAALQTTVGQLDTRVQELIARKTAEATAAQQSNLRVDETHLRSIPGYSSAMPAEQQAYSAALARIGTNPAQPNPNDILLINKMMGKTTQADMLNAEQIKGMFMQGDAQIADALKAGMGNSLKVSQMDMSGLGMGSKEELANKLGISVADMDNLSVNDFLGKMHEYQQKELTRTTDLKNRAMDPLLGQAERQQARLELKGAGATGLRTAEEGVADIKDQIAQANTVSFGGQNMSIETLLKDETMTAIVSAYLLDPNSESSKKLAAAEPGLVDWIKANELGLQKLAEGIGNQVTQFADIQAKVKDLAAPTIDGAKSQIPDEVMKTLMGDSWGKLTASMPTPPAIISMMHDTAGNPDEKRALYDTVMKLHGLGPQYVAELKDLTSQQLRELGLTSKNGAANYVDYVKDSMAISTLPEDPKAIIGAFGGDIEGLSAKLNESAMRAAMGLDAGGNALSRILDPDGDGRLNMDSGRIKNELSALLQGKKLRDLVGQGSVEGLPSLTKLVAGAGSSPLSGETRDLFEAVKGGFADGDFNAADAVDASRNIGIGPNKAALSRIESLMGMMQRAVDSGKGMSARDGVQKLRQIGMDNASDMLKQDFFPKELLGGDGQEYGHWGNRVKAGQILDGGIKGAMEETLRKLDGRGSTGGFEGAAARDLASQIRLTLQKNADLEAKRDEESRKRAEQEAQARRAAAEAEYNRKMAEAASRRR